jgi:hypothetical protein
VIESACHIGRASHLVGDDMEFADGPPAEVFQRHLYVPGTDSLLSPRSSSSSVPLLTGIGGVPWGMRWPLNCAPAESGKSAADHLFVPLKAVLDQRWWVAAEVAAEDTCIEHDPLSLQVDQVPRESSRRNSLGLEPNFDTSGPGIRHSLPSRTIGSTAQAKPRLLVSQH